jgi:hypothetical protein
MSWMSTVFTLVIFHMENPRVDDFTLRPPAIVRGFPTHHVGWNEGYLPPAFVSGPPVRIVRTLAVRSSICGFKQHRFVWKLSGCSANTQFHPLVLSSCSQPQICHWRSILVLNVHPLSSQMAIYVYILYIHMSSIGSMFCSIFRQTSFLRQVRPLPRPFPRQCFSLAKTLPGLMTRGTSVGKDWPHGKVTIHENPHEEFFGFVYDVLLSFMMFYDVLWCLIKSPGLSFVKLTRRQLRSILILNLCLTGAFSFGPSLSHEMWLTLW